MKNYATKLLLLFCVFFVLTFTVEYFFRTNLPSFHSEIISEFKRDSILNKEVGSYLNHEFSYPTSDLDFDSLHFELIIFGTHKKIIYSGLAKKTDDNWILNRVNSKIE